MNTQKITSVLTAIIFTLLIPRVEAAWQGIVRLDENNKAQYINIPKDINYHNLVEHIGEFASIVYEFDRANIPFFNKVKDVEYKFISNFKERFKKVFPNSQKFTSLALDNPKKANDIMRKITMDNLVFTVKDWFKRDRARVLKNDEKNNIDRAVRTFREKRGELASQCDAEIRRAKGTKRGGRSKELHKHIINLTIDKAVKHYRETVKNLDIKLQEDIESYKAPLRDAIEILKSSISKSTLQSLKTWDFVRFLTYRSNNINVD